MPPGAPLYWGQEQNQEVRSHAVVSQILAVAHRETETHQQIQPGAIHITRPVKTGFSLPDKDTEPLTIAGYVADISYNRVSIFYLS